MMRAYLLIFGLLVGHMASAQAQTPLETVAFLFGGPNADVRENEGVAAYRAQWPFEGKTAKISGKLERLEDCVYRQTVTGEKEDGSKAYQWIRKVDFKEVSDFRVCEDIADVLAYSFVGSSKANCIIQQADGKPNSNCLNDFGGRVNASIERWQRAYTHLRGSACKGRAF